VSSLAATLDNTKSLVELPVYLPDNCPSTATRLIVSKIYKDIILVVLCGQEPPTEVLENEALNAIKESQVHQDYLKKLSMMKRGTSFALDEHVLGVVMIREDLRIVTRCGNFDESRIKEILVMVEMEMDTDDRVSDVQRPQEAYVKLKRCNGFHISQNKNHLFILFPMMLPLYQMRKICLKTMSLFKDKKIWPQV